MKTKKKIAALILLPLMLPVFALLLMASPAVIVYWALETFFEVEP